MRWTTLIIHTSLNYSRKDAYAVCIVQIRMFSSLRESFCLPSSAAESHVAMTLTLRGLRVGMADTVNFEKVRKIGNFRLITALDVIFKVSIGS